MDLQLQREIREMKIGHRSKGELCHTLEGMLQAMNVTSLRKLGNMYGIIGFSRMDKPTLIPYIWQQMTTQRNMETMLSCLDELNWAFFKKSVQQREYIDDEALPSDYMVLVRIGVLGVYEDKGRIRYVIPEAIKAVYNQLQQSGFVQKLERENLLRKYADAAVNLYGIIRKNDFLELFNQYNERKTNMEEVESTLKDGKRYYQWHKQWRNYLVNTELSEKACMYFVDATEEKPRYIPDKDEFLKYREWEYYEQIPQAAALEEQLLEHTGDSIKTGHIMTGLLELHRHNVVMQEYIDLLEENEVILSFEETERLFKNLMEWQNNFRMWANNGHTPTEIVAMGYDSFWFSEPSFHAQAAPTKSSKVGRNDPCPCGSGKKFKKCCGSYLSFG